MKTLTTSTFSKALMHAEVSANYDLDGKWAVCIGHGVFLACPLSMAWEHDYHIVSVTIY